MYSFYSLFLFFNSLACVWLPSIQNYHNIVIIIVGSIVIDIIMGDVDGLPC